MVHNRRFELRVRIHSVMKSKQPLLLNSSTIDIVARRNITMDAASPTYFKKTCSLMKYLTASLVAMLPANHSL